MVLFGSKLASTFPSPLTRISTVPGSPAWVGKAERFAVNLPDQGWTFEFSGRNAIQSDWTIDYRGGAA